MNASHARPGQCDTPEHLQPKGDGRETPIALAAERAETAIAKLMHEYPAMALADVAQARQALADAGAMPDRRSESLAAAYAIAHNLKGQGGSFGFPLVTRIADSLARLLRAVADGGPAELKLADAHLDALTIILKRPIRGDGGAAGSQLAQKLEALTAQFDR